MLATQVVFPLLGHTSIAAAVVVALCMIFMILVSLENVKKCAFKVVARLPQRLKSTLFEIFSNGAAPKGPAE